MQYDVVIVGAGPAGLAAAIRLKQLSAQRGTEVSVCVIEKGSEVGAHILSGAVMDPRAISELFPDWQERDAPLNAPVSEDRFLFLTERGSYKVPNWMLPACFRNHGNYVISLANVCRWLGQQAESLGVEIFPGFAAAEVLYQDNRAVRGVATGDMGVNRAGEKTDAYQPGIDLHGRYTFFAEGCRGHLGKQLESNSTARGATAGLRHRPEGALGDQPGEAPVRPGNSQRRLAAGARYLWRLVPLSLREQPGRGRFRRRTGLFESLSRSLRGISALQDPPGDPRFLRRRQAHCLRRPGDSPQGDCSRCPE
jgi:flavin-dependent dehydrogenase